MRPRDGAHPVLIRLLADMVEAALADDNGGRYRVGHEAQMQDVRDAVLPGAADDGVLPAVLQTEGVPQTTERGQG